MMMPRLKLYPYLLLLLVLEVLTGCTTKAYPKILALGFVDGGFEISVLDLNAGSRSYITNSRIIAPSSFSYCHTKKEIVYSAPVENGEELILWQTNYDTYSLTDGNNVYNLPTWSNDCSYIAFNSRSVNSHVYLMNMQDNKIHPLMQDQEIATEGAYWSPDSKLVVTFAPNVDSLNNKVEFGLILVDSENGNTLKQLSISVDYPFSKVAWSKDGKSFIFSAKQGNSLDLYSYDIASGETTTIVSSVADDQFPVMSPNGELLAFLQSSQNKFEVSIFNFSTQSIEKLSDNQGIFEGLLWLDNNEVIYSKYVATSNTTGFYLLNLNNKQNVKLGDWDGQFIDYVLFP